MTSRTSSCAGCGATLAAKPTGRLPERCPDCLTLHRRETRRASRHRPETPTPAATPEQPHADELTTGTAPPPGRVATAIEAALDTLAPHDRDSWRALIARVLARALDTEPTAAVARELRATMAEISGAGTSLGESPVDQLQRRREARRAQARGSKPL